MTRCARTWEVEAARDGRLTASQQSNLEQHLKSCAPCADERRALAELATALRDLPVSDGDQLKERRQRQELLSRAHAQRVALPPPRTRRWVAAGVLVSAAAALTLWIRVPRGIDADESARVRSTLVLEPELGARYVRQRAGWGELIELSQGRLKLRATHDPKRRILLRTPDGEVEDLGTVFAVEVEGGRTQSIEVFEGLVVARIRGQAARELHAGETHLPYAEPQASPAPRQAAHTPSARPAGEPRLNPEGRSPKERVDARGAAREQTVDARAAAREQIPARAESAPSATAADDFARALAQVEAGDNTSAAQLLRQFRARHPDDARAEDAAFLQVVVLLRAGREHEARSAAEDYLSQYPRGFRVREVEQVLAHAKAPSL